MPRTRPTLRVGRGLIKEVGVGIFDAVIVGDWEAVRVWVVDCGGEIKDGSRAGSGTKTAPTVIGGWEDDADPWQ